MEQCIGLRARQSSRPTCRVAKSTEGSVLMRDQSSPARALLACMWIYACPPTLQRTLPYRSVKPALLDQQSTHLCTVHIFVCFCSDHHCVASCERQVTLHTSEPSPAPPWHTPVFWSSSLLVFATLGFHPACVATLPPAYCTVHAPSHCTPPATARHLHHLPLHMLLATCTPPVHCTVHAPSHCAPGPGFRRCSWESGSSMKKP